MCILLSIILFVDGFDQAQHLPCNGQIAVGVAQGHDPSVGPLPQVCGLDAYLVFTCLLDPGRPFFLVRNYAGTTQ